VKANVLGTIAPRKLALRKMLIISSPENSDRSRASLQEHGRRGRELARHC
jgi:hypothetical protein